MQPLLDAAAELSERLLAPEMPDDEREEGRRYVAGLLSFQLGRALVGSDPQEPHFVRCMDSFSKWGLENPDALYRSAAIDGDAEYVIAGRLGTCADVVIEVLTGLAGDDGTTGEGVSFIDVDTLEVAADGSYEIHVGGEPRAGNHLPTGPRARELFVRHLLGDWEGDVGEITIERVSTRSGERASVADRLERAAERLVSMAGFMEEFAAKWRAGVPMNSCIPPAGERGGGYLPGQRNAVGQWEIGRDEALVVSIDPVPNRLMSVTLGHPRWFVSLDYRNHLCHLNEAQARRSSDGRYHYVIGHADPGTPNWLDTTGRESGFMFLRWQGVGGEDPVTPEFAVVPSDAVRERLPGDEPTVTAEQRARALAARRAAVDRRFFGR